MFTYFVIYRDISNLSLLALFSSSKYGVFFLPNTIIFYFFIDVVLTLSFRMCTADENNMLPALLIFIGLMDKLIPGFYLSHNGYWFRVDMQLFSKSIPFTNTYTKNQVITLCHAAGYNDSSTSPLVRALPNAITCTPHGNRPFYIKRQGI